MKVWELIKKLKELDPELDVIADDEDGDIHLQVLEASEFAGCCVLTIGIE